MTPILRQLKSWQAREWVYSASVAVAAVALVAVAGLALACLLDNVWDLLAWDGTPFWARLFMAVGQLAAYLGVGWLALRSVKAPSLVALAGRAEREFAEYDHRLVTALQLNREGARTRGMSKELITAVTDEALAMTGRRKLASLADPTRLLWAGGLLLPVLLFATTALLLFPQTTTALLLRQLLVPADIPRTNAVENVSAGPFPAGDPMQLTVKVSGPVDPSAGGEVRVVPEGGERKFHLVYFPEGGGVKLFHTADDTARYQLRYTGTDDNGDSFFVADLPPATDPFTFTARVGDGKMRAAAGVKYEPRPVVTKVDAWVLAPAYVDPEGKRRFATLAPHGQVVCHPDCSVRVRAELSKAVRRAEVVLAGKAAEHRIRMEPDAARTTATATFDIPPGVNGYRIEVTDDFGFNNLTPTGRGISVLTDHPPEVELNKELLMAGSDTGPPADYEVTGMPLVLGGQIQIGYQAHGYLPRWSSASGPPNRVSLGIARAAIIYRVNDGPWTQFNLKPVTVDPERVGRFRPELGIFETYDETRNNELYLVPAADPEQEPGGLTAGGRYNFLTAALVKTAPDGNTAKLVVGDRVEFRVAVYDRRHEVYARGLGVVGELLNLIGGGSGQPLADKVKEFAELPLPETAQVKAARAALASNPKTAGPALRAVQAALRSDRPIPMTDPELADRPAEQRAGQGRPAGYSLVRSTTVVTPDEFKRWQDQKARSRERLRELDKAQRGVFGEKKE